MSARKKDAAETKEGETGRAKKQSDNSAVNVERKQTKLAKVAANQKRTATATEWHVMEACSRVVCSTADP